MKKTSSYLQQQRPHKDRTDGTHAQRQRPAGQPPPGQAHARLARAAAQHARGGDGNSRPGRHLAEVVGVAAPAPQAGGDELLAVLLLALGPGPGRLLPVSRNFEQEAEGEEAQAQHVGGEQTARCERGAGGQRVQGQHGEGAEGYPLERRDGALV